MSLQWDDPSIRELIQRALDEDIGAGDVTTEACVPAGATASGIFVTRQPLVLAGTQLLPLIYGCDDVELFHPDGCELEPRCRSHGFPGRQENC